MLDMSRQPMLKRKSFPNLLANAWACRPGLSPDARFYDEEFLANIVKPLL